MPSVDKLLFCHAAPDGMIIGGHTAVVPQHVSHFLGSLRAGPPCKEAPRGMNCTTSRARELQILHGLGVFNISVEVMMIL